MKLGPELTTGFDDTLSWSVDSFSVQPVGDGYVATYTDGSGVRRNADRVYKDGDNIVVELLGGTITIVSIPGSDLFEVAA